jgi:hypothetical protein
VLLTVDTRHGFPYIGAKIIHPEEFQMDKWTFGVTMLVVGMGGTLLTLGIMSMIIALLKKIFPYKKEAEEKA